jgi:hypothetical protein
VTGSVSVAAAAAGGCDGFTDDKEAAEAENEAARAGKGRGSHASGTSLRALRGLVCERGSGCVGYRRSWTPSHACSSIRLLACLECPKEAGHSC